MQQLLNRVFIGSIYALFAIGFTLVFGILDRLNLAHPAVFAASAFVGIELVEQVGLSIWMALPLVFVFGGVMGLIIERVAFRPLKNRPDAHSPGSSRRSRSPAKRLCGMLSACESPAWWWGPGRQGWP